MPNRTVSAETARIELRELIDLLMAERDAQVVVTRYRKPVAVLLSYQAYQAIEPVMAAIKQAAPA